MIILIRGAHKVWKKSDFGPKIAYFCHLGGETSISAQILAQIGAYFKDKYLKKVKTVKVLL